MAKLTGVVAVLNDQKNAVKEIRDLGSIPIDVKSDNVRPFIQVHPALGANQYYSSYNDVIAADKVTRTWSVATYDYNAIDQNALNAALTAEGSVVRSLGLTLFDAINQQNLVVLDAVNEIRAKLVPPLQAYTLAQFKAALVAKGKTPFYTMAEFLAALQANMRN